jgi:hypothetical protein
MTFAFRNANLLSKNLMYVVVSEKVWKTVLEAYQNRVYCFSIYRPIQLEVRNKKDGQGPVYKVKN